MRDRLDTMESITEEYGQFSRQHIENHKPSQADLERREAKRQQFLDNLFSVMTQEAAEVANSDSKARFDAVISDLATQS